MNNISSIQQVNGNWLNRPAPRAHFRRSTKSFKIATGKVFFNETTTNTNSPLAQIKKRNVNFIRMGTEYQELRKKTSQNEKKNLIIISFIDIVHFEWTSKTNGQNERQEQMYSVHGTVSVYTQARSTAAGAIKSTNSNAQHRYIHVHLSHAVSFPKIINSKRNFCWHWISGRRERSSFFLIFASYLCPPKIYKLF